MDEYVFALFAHVDSGKTTLAEALLYVSETIQKPGRVDKADAFLDYNTLERRRGITVFNKAARFHYGAADYVMLDTPGHADLLNEAKRAIAVCDFALLLLDINQTLSFYTRNLWALFARYKLPVFIFVNKQDLANVALAEFIKKLQKELSNKIVNFFNESAKLNEELALSNERLFNEYFLTKSCQRASIIDAVKKRELFPLAYGSALKLENIQAFLNLLTTYKFKRTVDPSLKARVYQLTHDSDGQILNHVRLYNADYHVKDLFANGEKIEEIRLYNGASYTKVNYAAKGTLVSLVGPKKLQVGDTFGNSDLVLAENEIALPYYLVLKPQDDALAVYKKLQPLVMEEPALALKYQSKDNLLTLNLKGELQAEILKELIKERFGLVLNFKLAEKAAKESIKNTVSALAHYGENGHYAEIQVKLEPCEDKIKLENLLPKRALPIDIVTNLLNALKNYEFHGVLADLALTQVKISLIAVKYSANNYKLNDFIEAAKRAIRAALLQADSIILCEYAAITWQVKADEYRQVSTILNRYRFNWEQSEAKNADLIKGRLKLNALYDLIIKAQDFGLETSALVLEQVTYQEAEDAKTIIKERGYDALNDTERPSSSLFYQKGRSFTLSYLETAEYLASANEEGLTVPKEVSESELKAILAKANPASTKKYVPKVKSVNTYKSETVNKPTCLLADAYNIIYALPELNTLPLASARERLIDLLLGYAAMAGYHLIVVFDAYLVKDNPLKRKSLENAEIIYTKAEETADMYIERSIPDLTKQYRVIVISDDNLIRLGVSAKGALLMSNKALAAALASKKEFIKKQYT